VQPVALDHPFRRHADVFAKQLLQVPLANPVQVDDVVHFQDRSIGEDRIHETVDRTYRGRYGAGQPRTNEALRDSDPLIDVAGVLDPAGKLASGGAEDRRAIDDPVSQLGDRSPEQRPEPGRPEGGTEHVAAAIQRVRIPARQHPVHAAPAAVDDQLNGRVRQYLDRMRLAPPQVPAHRPMLRQCVAEIRCSRVRALLVHAEAGVRLKQSPRRVYPANIALRVRVSSRRRPAAVLTFAP
jgi:hypothetical protein